MLDRKQELVKQLTLEEKANLCSGADAWRTFAVDRLQIPAVFLADGPHGLRKEETRDGKKETIPATCFPSESCIACSWDRKLTYEVGNAIAEECLAQGVSVLLGPGTNIKRSPLCGRNFEYFSEDPYLSSQLAAGYIRGVQSRGVGSVLKHFAANNQETRRMSVSVEVTQRALHEIYLASFEDAVKNGKPWAVMCAYNRVNGAYCSQNQELLTGVLREDWQYDGVVISDWGAVDQRVDALCAGLDLEMPSSKGVGAKKIIAAVQSGKLLEQTLDKTVYRILSLVEKCGRKENKAKTAYAAEHHAFAKKAACESMVLLKNANGLLPLAKSGTIAVIGDFSEKPRYQGAGSSCGRPTKLDIPLQEIRKAAAPAQIQFARGYAADTDQPNDGMAAEAAKLASAADVAIVFAGLPESYESEGYDRTHLQMPQNQIQLIERVCAVQKNTVVVLSNGAPIEMPWLTHAAAVLEGYLGGQAFGSAVADLLFGKENPCGKLAETFPAQLCDTPAYLNFPGEKDRVSYGEGIFVGYRYYEKKKIPPLFPFGHGLSYTNFGYRELQTDHAVLTGAADMITVKVRVRNLGKYAGKEVVQLYIGQDGGTVIRPEKELKGFEKILLQPGEEKEVSFVLDRRAFSYYDTEEQAFVAEDGTYTILVGSSSADIRQTCQVRLQGQKKVQRKITRNSTLQDLLQAPNGEAFVRPIMSRYANRPAQDPDLLQSKEFLSARHSVLRALLEFVGPHADDAELEELLERVNRNQ